MRQAFDEKDAFIANYSETAHAQSISGRCVTVSFGRIVFCFRSCVRRRADDEMVYTLLLR